MSRLKSLAIAVSLVLALAAHSEAASPWAADDLMDKPAPTFTAKNLDGGDVLSSSFAGKVVVLNFWATWCKPCKDEMPSLDKLYGMYKARGLVVIGMSTDKGIKPINKFLKKVPLNFPILWDSELDAYSDYKVFSLPMTFIIDADGILRFKYMGEMNWTAPDMIAIIEKLLPK